MFDRRFILLDFTLSLFSPTFARRELALSFFSIPINRGMSP
jgi:hypothetical protein